MTRTLLLVPALALALAACDQQDHTIVAKAPGQDKAAPPPIDASALPPSIQSSKTFRCKDNSLVYVDWMSDGTARVKTDKAALAAAPAEGELKGAAGDTMVTYKGKACHL